MNRQTGEYENGRAGRHAASRPIAGWRLWLFRMIAVVAIPAVALLLLEAVLRLVGYGFTPSFTIPCKVNGTACYRDNFRFAWRFFPPTIARTASPFVFPADKPPDTCRIFILGDSAAAGTPETAFSFGRILQVMLRQQYPGAQFEVITAAMPAINSHAVLEIAKDCARRKPDVFILYVGNNEVVGPYGAGTVFSPLSSNLSLIRLGIAFKATRLGQLLTNSLAAVGAGKAPHVWGGMGMFLEKQVTADDPSLGVVYRHFERNLWDIPRTVLDKRIPTIFCTIPTNLKDNPPFASLYSRRLTEPQRTDWQNLYEQGVADQAQGRDAEAMEHYYDAARIDSRHAELQFRMGDCTWAMGQFDQARRHFTAARELDTLRFRASTRTNQTIRDAAGSMAREDVFGLIDAEKVFAEKSPHGIPGKELFYEHVHMNFSGNYLMAATLFEKIQDILPHRIRRFRIQGQPVPSEADCARLLAYTDWSRYKIADEVLNMYVKQPPFTGQLDHVQRIAQMERDLKTLQARLTPEVLAQVRAQYRWAIEQAPMDWQLHWKYGEFLEEQGDEGGALQQYRQVLQYVPHYYDAYAKIGLLFGKGGNLEAAVAENTKALRINPLHADARFNLGLAYQLQHRPAQASKEYSKAIRSRPDYATAYNNLALVLYEQGKVDKAVQTYRRGLAAVPDDLDLHYNLGLMLEKQGLLDQAEQELQAALKIDPNSAKTRKALEAILQKRR